MSTGLVLSKETELLFFM